MLLFDFSLALHFNIAFFVSYLADVNLCNAVILTQLEIFIIFQFMSEIININKFFLDLFYKSVIYN